jgi:thiamine biosynthesis lipoprotein ApbE
MVADALATMFMAVGEEQAVALAMQMRDSVRVYFVIAPHEGEEFEVFSTLEE